MPEEYPQPVRKIIHIDMDAFFASVEQRDRPELRGVPVIVGGSAERRGVVSTCSYEARAFGVHSAMPMKTAQHLCPQAAFLPGDYAKYRQVSETIRAIFFEYTDLVEPISIDEAYLDVTGNKRNNPSATRLAREIQRRIFEETRLTASAGVSYNKFLAKVASDLRKPAGLTVIRPEEAQAFLDSLPVEKFHGIGHVSAAKLQSINVRTGHDLRQLDRSVLTSLFGKTGLFYYNIVRGIDERPVDPAEERKSVGKETTFAEDCSDLRKLRILIRTLSHKVARRLQTKALAGKTVTVKVRYGDFTTVTRSASFHRPVNDGNGIGEIALSLAAKTEWGKRPVRLLGVTVGNFPQPGEEEKAIQLEFDFFRNTDGASPFRHAGITPDEKRCAVADDSDEESRPPFAARGEADRDVPDAEDHSALRKSEPAECPENTAQKIEEIATRNPDQPCAGTFLLRQTERIEPPCPDAGEENSGAAQRQRQGSTRNAEPGQPAAAEFQQQKQ